MPEITNNNNEDKNESTFETSQKLQKYEILSKISDLEILAKKAAAALAWERTIDWFTSGENLKNYKANIYNV